LPTAVESFVHNGLRYEFVGWSEDEYAADNWIWGNASNRILPTGTGTAWVSAPSSGAAMRRFALYDVSSHGVQYSNLDLTDGGTSALGSVIVNGNVQIGINTIDNSQYIAIPAAVRDWTFANRGFMRPVTEIRESAFRNVSELNGQIIIGESVRVIGARAFERTNASEIIFRHTASSEHLEIRTAAFAYNYHLTGTLSLPAVTRVIAGMAFFEATGITAVASTTTVLQTIGADAFARCYDLATFFELPTSITSIGIRAFAETKIAGFVDFGNDTTTMMARDGNIYARVSADNYSLVVYAPGNTETYANLRTMQLMLRQKDGFASANIERIGHYAFAHHEHIERIFIPVGTRVSHAVFANMRKLSNLFIEAQTIAQFQINPYNAFHEYQVSAPNARIRFVIAGTQNNPLFIDRNPFDMVAWRDSTSSPYRNTDARLIFTTSASGL
jgi:hypothetical protein